MLALVVTATNGISESIVNEIEYPILMSILTKTVGISLSSQRWNDAIVGIATGGTVPVKANPTTVPLEPLKIPVYIVNVLISLSTI